MREKKWESEREDSVKLYLLRESYKKREKICSKRAHKKSPERNLVNDQHKHSTKQKTRQKQSKYNSLPLFPFLNLIRLWVICALAPFKKAFICNWVIFKSFKKAIWCEIYGSCIPNEWNLWRFCLFKFFFASFWWECSLMRTHENGL